MAEEHDDLVRVLEARDPTAAAHRFAAHGRPKSVDGSVRNAQGVANPMDGAHGRPEFAIRMP